MVLEALHSSLRMRTDMITEFMKAMRSASVPAGVCVAVECGVLGCMR